MIKAEIVGAGSVIAKLKALTRAWSSICSVRSGG